MGSVCPNSRWLVQKCEKILKNQKNGPFPGSHFFADFDAWRYNQDYMGSRSNFYQAYVFRFQEFFIPCPKKLFKISVKLKLSGIDASQTPSFKTSWALSQCFSESPGIAVLKYGFIIPPCGSCLAAILVENREKSDNFENYDFPKVIYRPFLMRWRPTKVF